MEKQNDIIDNAFNNKILSFVNCYSHVIYKECAPSLEPVYEIASCELIYHLVSTVNYTNFRFTKKAVEDYSQLNTNGLVLYCEFSVYASLRSKTSICLTYHFSRIQTNLILYYIAIINNKSKL